MGIESNTICTQKRDIIKLAVMSEYHLTSESQEPPKIDGLLRVYSMKLCPFAERVRLVLRAKKLPHDVVNINLQNKPNWFLKINPKGQVPALYDNGNIIIESIDISDYLDNKYPKNNSLYPIDPEAKKKDQEIIKEVVGPAIQPLSKVQFNIDLYTPEKVVEELLPNVQPLEEELTKRNTPFFGGDKPGMIDYMIWPWAERSAALAPLLGVKKLPLKNEQIPKLRIWAKSMLEDPATKDISHPSEVYVKMTQTLKNNTFSYSDMFNESS